MNLLYLVKHFPCLSQTFVANEIMELTRRGAEVHVASALDLREGQAPLDPRISPRVAYLEYDYLYRYAATGRHSDADVEAEVHRLRGSEPGLPAGEALRRLWEVASRLEPELSVRRRGFLEGAALLRRVEAGRIERIHCDFAEDNVKLAYLLNQAAGIPFSFKMRAYDVFAEPLPELALVASAAERVLTISRYNQEYLCRELGLPPEKVSVVYDGVDLESLPPVEEYRHRPFTIVSIGRLVEKKGHRHLLEACRILKQRGLELRCDVYGDGPLAEPLREQAKQLGVEGVVRFLGSRPHRQVLDALAGASALVLPCVVARNGDRDATPNVLMEAMAREIPVVSTRLSGIPEVVEDGVSGLLVEPGDAQAVADAIQRIHADRSLAELLRRSGRRRVESRFTVERTVQAFLSLLPPRQAVA
jgi:glycosyltransferase involved in cell wall biosynthesis